MKKGKNHVSWNENAPESVADTPESREKTSGDSDEIGSPPRINKTTSVTSNAQFEEMKKHLKNLKQEEREVDQYLDYLTQQAEVFNGRQPASREQAACLPPGVGNVADHMYVRFKDITAMPEYSADTVIGIRAPSGTSLEVPDPDQGMTPGERRFEMYLSSKGTEGAAGEPASGKGDPINVYLVRPRAEDQAKQGPDGRQQGSFVQQTPPAKRGPPQISEPEPEPKSSNIKVEQSRQPPPEFGPPQSSQRPGEPQYGYGMPLAHRGGEWGHGQNRPPYPPQESRGPYGKEHGPPSQRGPPPPGYPGGPPPGYGPPPHHQYQDPAWRPPPQGYGGPPPRGPYPPPSSRQQFNEPPHPSAYQQQQQKQQPKADRDERAESQSSPDRARDEGRYSSSRHFAPSRDGPQPGGPRDRNASPFRPRSDHFQPPRETGRPGPSGGTPPSRDGAVAYHPPTPVRDQQNLLSMPLSSPQGGSFGMPSSYFPSQYGSPPPGGQRGDVRSGDVQFPMPPLPGRDSNRGEPPTRWHPPPRPHMSSSSRAGAAGEPPFNIAPRSRR